MERERESRNPIRARQLSSGDVSFVIWRSSSNIFAKKMKFLKEMMNACMHVTKLLYVNDNGANHELQTYDQEEI